MKARRLAVMAAFVSIVALAIGASTASSGAPAQSRFGTPTTNGSQHQVGSLVVKFTVTKFIKRHHRLYAVGAAIAQFKPTAENPNNLPTKAVRRTFTARVLHVRRFASAQTICPVLDLTLGPLDLNLLGLMVHLDKVHLTITADSEGGLLGRLFCSIANGKITLGQAATRLTKVAHRSGLSAGAVRTAVPLFQQSSGSGSALTTGSTPQGQMKICTVLDLTLGPLDLNLLGLMVHLDTVHLVITADSEGGLLGSLLCPS
jgi:hypothetical protein